MSRFQTLMFGAEWMYHFGADGRANIIRAMLIYDAGWKCTRRTNFISRPLAKNELTVAPWRFEEDEKQALSALCWRGAAVEIDFITRRTRE